MDIVEKMAMNLIIFTAVLVSCDAANLNRGYLPSQEGNSETSLEGLYFSHQEPDSQHEVEEDAKNLDIKSTVPNHHSSDSFAYKFETKNGIRAEENGIATDGVKARGSFSYVGDGGKMYSIGYTADEDGYRPFGDHLPTSPPIPEAILRSIEQNARDEAAGIYDDGKYHPEENKSSGSTTDSRNPNHNTNSDHIQSTSHMLDTNYSGNIHPETPAYTQNTQEYYITDSPKYIMDNDQEIRNLDSYTDHNQNINHTQDTTNNYIDSLETTENSLLLQVTGNKDSLEPDINNEHSTMAANDDGGDSKYLENLQNEAIDYKDERTGIDKHYPDNGLSARTFSKNNININETPFVDTSEPILNEQENLENKQPSISHHYPPNKETLNTENMYQEDYVTKTAYEQIDNYAIDERQMDLSTSELKASEEVSVLSVSERNINRRPPTDNQRQENIPKKYTEEKHHNIDRGAENFSGDLPEVTTTPPESDRTVLYEDTHTENIQILDDVEVKPESRLIDIPDEELGMITSPIQDAEKVDESSFSTENIQQINPEIDQNGESPGFSGTAEAIDFIDDILTDQTETDVNENQDESKNSNPKIEYGPSFEIRTTLEVAGETKQYNLSEIDDSEAKRKKYCQLRCKAHLDAMKKKLNVINEIHQKLTYRVQEISDIRKNGEALPNIAPTMNGNNLIRVPQIDSNDLVNITTESQVGLNESSNIDDVVQQNGNNHENVKDVLVNITNTSQTDEVEEKSISNIPQKDFNDSNNEFDVSNTPRNDPDERNNGDFDLLDISKSNEEVLPNEVQSSANIPQNYNNKHNSDANLLENQPSMEYVTQSSPSSSKNYFEGAESKSHDNDTYATKNDGSISETSDNIPRKIQISEHQYAKGKSLEASELGVKDEESLSRISNEESFLDEPLLSTDSINERFGEDFSQTRRPPYYEPGTGYHY